MRVLAALGWKRLSHETQTNLLFLLNPKAQLAAGKELIEKLEIHFLRRDKQLAHMRDYSPLLKPQLGIEYTEWKSKAYLRVSRVTWIPLDQITSSPETMREVLAVAHGGSQERDYFRKRELLSQGWTKSHSDARVLATKYLLNCNPAHFKICCTFGSEGRLEVVDGGHRIAVAKFHGASRIRIWVTTGQIFSKRTTRLPLIFGNPIWAIDPPPDELAV